MKSTIHVRRHGLRSYRSTLDLGGEGEAKKLTVPRWYFISQNSDPYFDHVLKPLRQGTRALQSRPPCLGGVRVQPNLKSAALDNRHELISQGSGMWPRSRVFHASAQPSSRAMLSASVELCGASEPLCLRIVLFLAAV